MSKDYYPSEKPLEVEFSDYSLVGDNVGCYHAHCDICGYLVETLNEENEEPSWNINVIDRRYIEEDYDYSDFTEETVYDKQSAKAEVEKWAAKHTPETCLAAQKATQQELEVYMEAELEKEKGEISITISTEYYDCEFDINTSPIETEYELESMLMSSYVSHLIAEAGLKAETMDVRAACFYSDLDYSAEWVTGDDGIGKPDSFWRPKNRIPNPCKHEGTTREKHYENAKTVQKYMNIICSECNMVAVRGIPMNEN